MAPQPLDSLDIFSGISQEQRKSANRIAELIDAQDYDGAIHEFCARFLPGSDRERVLADICEAAPADAAARYYAAWALAGVERFDRVVQHLERLGTPIMPDMSLLVYSDFLEQTQGLAEQLDQRHDTPSVLIAAMPKSASSYLSSMVSSLADLPIARATFGQYPKLTVIPRWVSSIARGGCTTHDHIPPTEASVARLAEAGIRDLFVQYRDPRAAAWSAAMQQPERARVELFDLHVRWFNDWLDRWLRIREEGAPFNVHLIDYDDVRSRPATVLRRMFAISGINIPDRAIREKVSEAAAALHLYNFRQGDPTEWRRLLPAGTVAQSTALLTPRVVRLLRKGPVWSAARWLMGDRVDRWFRGG